jgi:dipeptidyl aminopeptidase/acylaminoacyl peptidase
MTPRKSALMWRLVFPVAIAILPLSLGAQSGGRTPDDILKQESYQAPAKELADAVTAPRYLNVTLTNASPDKKWFLDEIGDGPVVMKTFSKPFHELGGLFVDFKANRARPLTVRNNIGIQLISAADGTRKLIQLPAGARVSNAAWSPDGKNVAFYVHGEDATHIWIADAATGQSRQVTKTPVLATLMSSFDFTKDGKQIAAVLVPDTRTAMPQEPASPPGPSVKLALETDKNRLRTFPSLMSTPYQEQLLEWHATGQLALIDVAKGTIKRVGSPAMIRAIDLAPDGKYVRVTRMLKPFSYDVPVSNFGSVEEIWDENGKSLAKITERPINVGVADDTQPPPDPTQVPAAGGGRGGGNQTGKREVAWRTDGQGLTYVEQEPGPATGAGGGRNGRQGANAAPPPADDAAPQTGSGRGQQPPQRKDRVYQWLPPFDTVSQKVIYENPTRISGHRYSPDMQILFFSERVGQNALESAVYLSDTSKKYTLARYRADDIYANPGSILSTRGGGGGGRAGGGGRGAAPGGSAPVLLSADGGSVFFQGTAYDKSPTQVGPKSFIDKVAIKTGEKERIYQSDNTNQFERVSTVIDADAKKFIIQRETPADVPQNILLDGERRITLTKNMDPHEDLTRAKVERFVVERPDGFKFRVKVVLPADYKAGTRLPGLFWFYPREFATQDDYDRPDRTFNKNSFTNFGARSMEYFTRLGYAVIDPDTPIVGPQGQMNNNYVNDLRNDLSATIDELDRRQLVDRQRLAIGGHSYGAFSTVNAMVHTPFFKAGIAGDGAYNRTLTPLGFQSERRDLWEAPNVYMNMSPFLYANNLTGALLMYHNLGDQNVGTDPTNSMRLYHALNGLGKTTALYLYPLEDHGPVAKETLLDLWARWAAWLDKYVKNPQKPEPKKITTDQALVVR